MRHNVMMSCDLFCFDSPISVASWSAVDDRVMGGVSQSRMRHDPAGYAVFEGVVSLENNGGFASVRARAPHAAPTAAAHYFLDVCGDGKRYKLSLRMNERFDAVSYQAAFEPPPGAWSLLQIPVSAFIATFRGRRVLDAPALDAASVIQLSLMIADGQTGPFRLAIRALSTE
jgi:hypothetical protein